MAPRATWTGSISIGLVNIPIALYTGSDEANSQFNQLNSDTGNRVAYKRVDAVTEQEVPYDKIVKGYEVAKGQYVRIADEDLERLRPAKRRSMEIIATMPRSELDERLIEKPTYIGLTNDAAGQAYSALVAALERDNTVAIGTYVARNLEHLVALVPVDGQLVAHQLRWPEQIRELPEQELPAVPAAVVEQMSNLIQAVGEDNFTLEGVVNDYAKAVNELIQAKAAGAEFTVEEDVPTDPQPAADLMAALTASVEAAKEKRRATGTDA